MQTRLCMTICGTVLLAVVSRVALAEGELTRFERSERHMGTLFTVSLYADDQDSADAAFRAAFDRIGQLDRTMSDYRSESEITRLNDSRLPPGPQGVSDDVWRVLQRGQAFSRLTDGAFDMTLGQLTRLWRRSRRTRQLPTADRLARARATAGYRYLVLEPSDHTVTLPRTGVRLDLGGIAKGDALDQALIAVHQCGIRRVLINGGGDVLASDAPPGKPGWRIGLTGLSNDDGVRGVIRVANRAAATSGDLWQFVEIGGQRYSHLIDPETGLGLTRRSSVTVIAAEGITADALASAVSVLGPERGIQLLDSQGNVEGRIVYFVDGQVRESVTAGFRELMCETD